MGQLVTDVTDVLNYNKSKKQTETERQKVLAQIASDEKAKTNLVKKVLAAQRAQYGATGMSGVGMTEKAVLKRLRSETEEPFNEKKKVNLDKFKSIKSDKNLLKMLTSKITNLTDLFVG